MNLMEEYDIENIQRKLDESLENFKKLINDLFSWEKVIRVELEKKIVSIFNFFFEETII